MMFAPAHDARPPKQYLMGALFARGGMGTVHLGLQLGDGGVARVVAMKSLHAHLRAEPWMVRALEREAHVGAIVRHANVVQTVDVVEGASHAELVLVLEYVHGVSLGRLADLAAARGRRVPDTVLASIVHDLLHGLHAVHETVDDAGRAVDLVHRDVSAYNVIVGIDGVARLNDFGLATGSRDEPDPAERGLLLGRLSHMAPEQYLGLPLRRQADIYAAGIALAAIASSRRPPPDLSDRYRWRRAVLAMLPPALRAIVERATRPSQAERYRSALEMAGHLERTVRRASRAEVRTLVELLAGEALDERAAQIAALRTCHGSRPVPIVKTGERHRPMRPTLSDEATQVMCRRPAQPSVRRGARAGSMSRAW